MRAVGTCESGSKDRRLVPKPTLLSAKVVQGDRGAGSFFLMAYQLVYFWCRNCVWVGAWKADGDIKGKGAAGGASGFGFEFS